MAAPGRCTSPRSPPPQNIASAISTSSTTTTPVGSPNSSGRVNRPYPVEWKNPSKEATDSPNANTPRKTPATKKIPSSLSVDAATSDVPGQYPPMMKPTPMTSPPTTPGASHVGLTQRRAVSTSPTADAPKISTDATTMAVNMTFRTVISRR